MSVPNISAAATSAQGLFQTQEYQNLETSLQSQNATAAQRAFSSFLGDVQKAVVTTPAGGVFTAKSQATKDLQSVGNALKAGNLNAAQSALSHLKQDVQSASGAISGKRIHGHSFTNHHGASDLVQRPGRAGTVAA
jgi:hypothetical protein